MSQKIRITAGDLTVMAELNESSTAKSILEALPIQAEGNRWGDEIYFAIPVDAPLENGARAAMQVGELGYWPPGKAFCIFFGPTPASTGEEPRAASPVNPIGRIVGNAILLAEVRDGTGIVVAKA